MSNYNILMNLGPKASPRDGGYAMAALLVAMSVMAILLTAAMPTWSHMIRREKEEELIFRGNQYARAINQYQRKFANASPASVDVLIEQRLLRKKWKDPLAIDKEGEFQFLYLSSGMGSRAAGAGPGRAAGAGQPGAGGGTTYSTTASGGIVGVTSKNTGQSIKIYKDKQRYNEWLFIGMEQSQQAGAGGAGGRGGDGRGGRGGRDGRAGGAGSRGGVGGQDRGGAPDRFGPGSRGRGF
jgi:type II secretory pathway pseudopilin PulG